MANSSSFTDPGALKRRQCVSGMFCFLWCLLMGDHTRHVDGSLEGRDALGWTRPRKHRPWTTCAVHLSPHPAPGAEHGHGGSAWEAGDPEAAEAREAGRSPRQDPLCLARVEAAQGDLQTQTATFKCWLCPRRLRDPGVSPTRSPMTDGGGSSTQPEAPLAGRPAHGQLSHSPFPVPPHTPGVTRRVMHFPSWSPTASSQHRHATAARKRDQPGRAAELPAPATRAPAGGSRSRQPPGGRGAGGLCTLSGCRAERCSWLGRRTLDGSLARLPHRCGYCTYTRGCGRPACH